MGLTEKSFDLIFKEATGKQPFPYQKRLAEGQRFADLIEVSTGAGKTAAVVLAWLWRKRYAPEHVRKTTPRRLVYCLPMRVLVEQTRDSVILWLHRLGILAGHARITEAGGKECVDHYSPSWDDPDRIAVTVLMGGEDSDGWDIYPEHDAIVVGTQDMLLSRALNRGFAMSRYRWPMHFGLLNNDCFWVFDEIQLMGSGLATATQLAAFRNDDGLRVFAPSHCVWMSATLRRDWLETFDFRDKVSNLLSCTLQTEDRNHDDLAKRLNARKHIEKAAAPASDAKTIAGHVLDAHRPGTLTLVVVNTVERAVSLYRTIEAIAKKSSASSSDGHQRSSRRAGSAPGPAPMAEAPPAIMLLHSRFRPGDRERILQQLLSDPPQGGRIVISTQVVEAGVDISARVLFTEIAPWPSLVQRLGRCNRFGEYMDATVYWIEIPTYSEKGKKSLAAPYLPQELDNARAHLERLTDASPVGLSTYLNELAEGERQALFPYSPRQVVRRKDVIELFDTTPDLAGSDIDVSRFIRDADDLDVEVFWRDIAPGETPYPDDDSGKAPVRGELCPVPFTEFRNWIVSKNRKRVFRWDYLERKWSRADPGSVFPGQVFLIPFEEGGYSIATGWSPESNARVEPVHTDSEKAVPPEGNDDELHLQGDWQTIKAHTDEVISEMERILPAIGLSEVDNFGEAIMTAARWHDRGKAHQIFQNALPLHSSQGNEFWAKAPGQTIRFKRQLDGDTQLLARGFRHELASALAMLAAGKQDLACYLAATHHGKVRLSIRSLPHEVRPPDPGRRFARGLWDGDQLPVTDLGNSISAPAIVLSLEAMELGVSEDGSVSWAERMLSLRDRLGPFRLAYLEALLRAADSRASAAHAHKSML